MEAAFQPEQWIEHADALRRMARALVSDEAQSEDLVQSAYLAALENPPPRPSRAWFGRVLRNRAVDARRKLRALDSSELAAGEAPSAAEVAQRLELHRVLVDAVESLREEDRRVVYLRYFQDRSPRVIAAQLGLPVKTVKTRLHRSLNRLREKLEARYGSGRDGWRALVATSLLEAPRAALATTVTLGGMAIMSKKLLGLSALAAVVIGLVLWKALAARGLEPDAATAGAKPGTELVAGSPAELDAPLERVRAAPREAAVVEEPFEVAELVTGDLRVAVVYADGEPAPNEVVYVRADYPSRTLRRTRTDAQGKVLIEGLEPGEVRIATGRGVKGWPKVEIVAGEIVEREVQVRAGIAVKGRVVDASGQPVAGASVWLPTGYTDWQGGNVIATSAADGTFELAHIDGQRSIGAFADGYRPSELVDLERLEPRTTPARVELVLPEESGGALSGRVFSPAGDPVAGACVVVGEQPDANFMTLDGTTVDVWTPRTTWTDEEGRYSFAGLPVPEEPLVALHCKAEGLAVWASTVRLVAGSEVARDITLQAGAVLQGRVTDAQGDPIAGAVIRAYDEAFDEVFIQSGQFDYESMLGFPSARSAADGTYRIDDVAPGLLVAYAHRKVESRFGGAAPCERDKLVDEDVQPGEVLTWNPVIEPGHTITGVVRYRDGFPMPNVFVSCRDESGLRFSLACGEDGTFQFVNLKHEAHAMNVQLWDAPEGSTLTTSGVWPDQGVVELVADYDRPVQGEPGTVTGVVEDAGRRFAEDAVLAVWLTSEHGSFRICQDVDGWRFKFGRIDPGRYHVSLLADGEPVHRSEPFELASGEDRDLGVLVTRPGGSVRFRLARAEGAEGLEPVGWPSRGGSRIAFEGVDELLVQNLSAGDYTLYVQGEGLARSQIPYTVVAGEETQVEIEVLPAVLRRVVVDWPHEADLGSLEIQVTDSAGRVRMDRTIGSANTTSRPYTADAYLPIGTFRARAVAGKGLSAEIDFAVTSLEPSAAPITLTLSPD